MKTKSNRVLFGYIFGKTVESCTEITRYGEVLGYKSDEMYMEEWRLRQSIWNYAIETHDWSLSCAKLKNWIVNELKQFTKKNGFKVEVSRRK